MNFDNLKELEKINENLKKERESILEAIKEFVDARKDLKTLKQEKAETIIYALRDSYEICNNNIELLTSLIEEIKNQKAKNDFSIVEEKDDDKKENDSLDNKINNNKTKKASITKGKYNKDNIKNKENNKESKKKNKTDCKENTLFISEKQKVVILPYKVKDLEKLLDDDNYSSIQDIIDKEYTIPYNNYKNPSTARFKEAYKLMKNKERATTKEAFDLATELMKKYNLHPAIITACNNIDELDIYLDYLENNELEKFDIFKIEYDLLPRKKSTTSTTNNKPKPKKTYGGKHKK